MADALERLRYDDGATVVVITGSGPAFCAGMDLKEFFTALRDKPAEYERITRIAVEWRGRTLRLYPKPTIAAINGFCFGGAFAIVEGCDLAIAAEEATFGLSEVNFGLFPGGAVSKALANIFRPRDALFYGLTGRPFDGKRAAEMGFVNYAVPASELAENVRAVATEIAKKNPEALRATKEGYRHSLDMGWDAAWPIRRRAKGCSRSTKTTPGARPASVTSSRANTARASIRGGSSNRRAANRAGSGDAPPFVSARRRRHAGAPRTGVRAERESLKRTALRRLRARPGL
jgi:trans-feruloyl-CoA hydratase/vanillin synthase